MSVPAPTHLPAMPLEEWKDTKTTLHLFSQIVGKVRLGLMPRKNHWWHVPLYLAPRGVTTRAIPLTSGRVVELRLDLVDHRFVAEDSTGGTETFSLEGRSVAAFHGGVMDALDRMGVQVDILAKPFDMPFETPFPEDDEHGSWDREAVERWWRVIAWSDRVFEEFAGRFYGKQTPVHLFWHSFDLALTRFSGERAPAMPEADPVSRDAYSHEVVSFGFWAGDESIPAPAYYAYAAPEPEGLTGRPLSGPGATWHDTGRGKLALLMYEDLRRADDPRQTLLSFLESAYRAGAELAGWDVDGLRTPWAEEL